MKIVGWRIVFGIPDKAQMPANLPEGASLSIMYRHGEWALAKVTCASQKATCLIRILDDGQWWLIPVRLSARHGGSGSTYDMTESDWIKSVPADGE